MAVQCTNCGHPIPSGQFRCGKCGHVAARESLDDFAGLGDPALGDGSLSDAVLSDLGDLDTAFEPVVRRTPAPSEHPARLDDELGGRESIVPKGTFASDAPTTPELPPDPKVPDVAAARREPEAPKRDASGPVRSAAASSTTRVRGEVAAGATGAQQAQPAPTSPRRADTSEPIKIAVLPVRPPFLASEILREDLSPREPARELQRLWTQCACAFGLAAVAVGTSTSLLALLPALLVGALLAVDRLVPDYARRATLLASIGGAGLAAVLAVRVALGAPALDALLGLSVCLLPAGLLLRAWHRASRVARVGVAAGVCTGLAWCLATSSPSLLALGFEWQSWLPALCWYLFAVLCLLALLAFMGDETTGGSDVWASGVLGWFALEAGSRFAIALWSPAGHGIGDSVGLVEPCFAVACAIGGAQLTAHRIGQRRNPTPSLRPPSLIRAKPTSWLSPR
jgi:hypothetical protein